MTLHRRSDEQFDIDPADDAETDEYIARAEEVFCSALCERCGLKHPEPATRCPHANVTHLRAAP